MSIRMLVTEWSHLDPALPLPVNRCGMSTRFGHQQVC